MTTFLELKLLVETNTSFSCSDFPCKIVVKRTTFGTLYSFYGKDQWRESPMFYFHLSYIVLSFLVCFFRLQNGFDRSVLLTRRVSIGHLDVKKRILTISIEALGSDIGTSFIACVYGWTERKSVTRLKKRFYFNIVTHFFQKRCFVVPYKQWAQRW